MQTKRSKPIKVRSTIAITKVAQDTMLDNGYCGARGMGEFLSQLVMDYHARESRLATKGEILKELRRLIDLLEVKENHDYY